MLTTLVTHLDYLLRNIFMDKKLLIEKIKDLTKKYYKAPIGERDVYVLEEIRNIINEYLAKNPADTDVRLRLVMLEYAPPLEDPELLVTYLNEILKYDSTNIYTILILAYTEEICWGGITDSVFEKLNNLSSKDSEIISMIELAKAWYYQRKNNNELYEKHLLNSINYCNKHVSNYTELANFYAKRGEKDKVKKFAKKALNNVQVVYIQGSITDITDVEDFINEFFKGTHITEPNLDSIYELLK